MPLARRKARDGGAMTLTREWCGSRAPLQFRALALPAAVLAAAALFGFEQPASVTDSTPTVSSLVVSPQAIALLPNQVADFMAVGFTSTGDTAQMSVTWSVTSGAITDTASSGGRHYGHYKAGSDTGTFKVSATAHPGGKAANATVTVTAGAGGAVVVAPPGAGPPAWGGGPLLAATNDSAGGGADR